MNCKIKENQPCCFHEISRESVESNYDYGRNTHILYRCCWCGNGYETIRPLIECNKSKGDV